MAKTAQPRSTPLGTIPPVAALLAWLIPGAGHWYLGRPVRAVILFITLHAMFWSGIAVGGIFTVNPREEGWWCVGQMCTGVSGLAAYCRQELKYREYLPDAQKLADEQLRSSPRTTPANAHNSAVTKLLSDNNLALIPPASGLAYVLSGVAGMLNLLCIFDAFMLSLMGRYGEPSTPPQPAKEAAR